MVERKRVLVRAAIACGIRPRREATGVRGTHRNPDLLERAPVIGCALVAEEPAAVGALEGVIHLEAAPVRAAGIRPAALVAVDAHPVPELGWVVREPPGGVRTALPAPRELPEPHERACGEEAR